MATPIWDATAVLRIINHEHNGAQTCVAAMLKQRRCRNPINMYNRDRAAKILDGLSAMEPCVAAMADVLHELAEICICRHQKTHSRQRPQIVSMWQRVILLEQERLYRQRTPTGPAFSM